MFIQRLSLQASGQCIASSPSALFKNVRRGIERKCNVNVRRVFVSEIHCKRFSTKSGMTGHEYIVKAEPKNCLATLQTARKYSINCNDSAYNLLCSLPEYGVTTVKLNNVEQSNTEENYSQSLIPVNEYVNTPLEELIKQFKLLPYILSKPSDVVNEQSIEILLISITRKQNSLSYLQLINIFSSVKLWQSIAPHNANLSEFLKKLEEHCCKAVKRWNLGQCLVVADYWYHLHGSSSSYAQSMIHAHIHYLENFPKTQFIQFLFYASVGNDQRLIKNVVLQRKLKKTIPTLSLNEIGILSIIIFKKLIKDDVFLDVTSDIAKRLIDINDIPAEEAVSAILRLLRSIDISYKLSMSLLDAFLQQIDGYNSFIHMQFCYFLNNRSIYNKEFMDKLMKALAVNLPSLRLTEIERLACSATLFNTRQATHQYIYPLIVEELRKPERVIECRKFLQHFISCVNHLTVAGVYPLDLISAVFQPSVLSEFEDKASQNGALRSMFAINCSLVIDGPSDFTGYNMDAKLRDELAKKCISNMDSGTAGSKNKHKDSISLNTDLGKFLHPAQPAIVNILPQFSAPDIVFCTNSEGDGIPIPESYFQQSEIHATAPLAIKGISWNAVIVVQNSMVLKPNNELKGNILHKIKLLEKLGYIVSLAKPTLGQKSTDLSKRNDYLRITLSKSTLKLKKRSLLSSEGSKPCDEESKLEDSSL